MPFIKAYGSLLAKLGMNRDLRIGPRSEYAQNLGRLGWDCHFHVQVKQSAKVIQPGPESSSMQRQSQSGTAHTSCPENHS